MTHDATCAPKAVEAPPQADQAPAKVTLRGEENVTKLGFPLNSSERHIVYRFSEEADQIARYGQSPFYLATFDLW